MTRTAGIGIVTITLNAAIDQTLFIPGFRAGEVNRVAREQSDAGGKGINVASFLSHFGHDVTATGFLGRDNAEIFTRLFTEKAITDRFIRPAGLTRVNIKIVDDDADRVTDINLPGLLPEAQHVKTLVDQIETLAQDANQEWFVLAGSLPSGLETSLYRNLAAKLKAAGKKLALDTSGPALKEAVKEKLDVIKPNIEELRELTGMNLETDQQIVAAARTLVSSGIALVAVSMGSHGAIFVTERDAILAQPPQITVKSTVGAGDAMVSGILHGQISQLPLEDLARMATAFSLAALGEVGPRLPPKSTVETFLPQITTTSVTI